MNPTKRRFYFDNTGHIFFETNVYGESTIEQEIINFKELSERNRDTLDVLELPFGANAESFATCSGYHVDPTTKEILFTFPDPNSPTGETTPSPSLESRVSALEEAKLADLGL